MAVIGVDTAIGSCSMLTLWNRLGRKPAVAFITDPGALGARTGTEMADSVDPETRSRMMSGIRGRDTKPELVVRRYLHQAGFRYRLHARALPGRPDLVLPKWTAAIFVNGCFWHGHEGCKYYRVPATRTDFWLHKIHSNRLRDSQNVELLAEQGWRVATVWECATRDTVAQLDELRAWIQSPQGILDLRAKGDD